MIWLDIYIVGGTLHFLGHWGSHNGYIPVGATTTTTTTIFALETMPKLWIKGFTPSKLYIFIWNVAKFLLTPQSNDRQNYEGNDAQEKFLTPMVPPMQRAYFFQPFFWLFQGLFLTASPVPVKMVVVVHNSANSSLGIMNRVRGRGVMVRGFFHRVRGRTGTQKSDLSMLLSTNFAILHETETKHPNLYLVKWKKL